jgi:hypothetical protein
MVVADIVGDIKQGRAMNVKKSVSKFHNTKYPAQLAYKQMQNPDFRQAIIDDLNKAKVIGKGGTINNVLQEGLDAVKLTKFGEVDDFPTRLAYIQEINRITGVYAPDRTDRRTLNVNMNVSPEELEERITELKEQVM